MTHSLSLNPKQSLLRSKAKMAEVILFVILFVPGLIGWIYEIRNETEEDKKKKIWLFEHGLY